MRRVQFSTRARADINSIFEYIAKDSPRAALRVVDALEAACNELADSARQYALMPKFEHRQLRQRMQRRYRIVFRVDGEIVYVVRVLHTARDHERLLRDDN